MPLSPAHTHTRAPLRNVSQSEIPHPNRYYCKKNPPKLQSGLSDPANALDSRRVWVPTWISNKVLRFYMQDSASLLVWAGVGGAVQSGPNRFPLQHTGKFTASSEGKSLWGLCQEVGICLLEQWVWSQDEAKCSERIPSSNSISLWKQVPFRSRNSHSGWESLSLCGAISHHPNGSHWALLFQLFEPLCDSCCHVPNWWCCALSWISPLWHEPALS